MPCISREGELDEWKDCLTSNRVGFRMKNDFYKLRKNKPA